MQLIPLSRVASTLLVAAASLHGDDFVSVQYMFYDEEDERTSVSAPSILIQTDLSSKYTLNMGFVYDDVTGATPNYYDAQSGASAYSRGKTTPQDIRYGNVNYYERRYVYSLGLQMHQDNADEVAIHATYSNEFDYRSYDGALSYQHYLDGSRNSALNVGAAYEYNAHLLWCYQNSECSDAQSGASARFNSHQFELQAGYSQILSQKARMEVTLFAVAEQGYLTNPYLNVVKGVDQLANEAYVLNEKRPTRRSAAGATLWGAYAISDAWALQGTYRYYLDDWRIHSHTVAPQLFWYAQDWVRVELLWRYYQQHRAYFYAPGVNDFALDAQFESSDYRLSTFTSNYGEVACHFTLSDDLAFNIAYGRYDASTQLRADVYYSGLTVGF